MKTSTQPTEMNPLLGSILLEDKIRNVLQTEGGIWVDGMGTYYETLEIAKSNYSDSTGNGVNVQQFKVEFNNREYVKLLATNIWD